MSGGSESSDCLRAQPCSLTRAVSLARGAANNPIIRMLPGVYVSGLLVNTPTTAPLSIVATGAAITSFTGIRVDGGANVSIRGIAATGSNFAVQCGSPATSASTLQIQRSTLLAGTSSANLVATANCKLSLTDVDVQLNDSTGSSLSLGTDTTFVGDRLRVRGQQQPGIQTLGQRVSMRLTNSILENPLILFSTTDSGAPGSQVYFGFNTVVLRDFSLNCNNNSGSAHRTVLLENNIMVAQGQTSAISGTTCTLVNNVLLPQPSAPATNIVADPQFVDAAAKNFRLRSTSPALGAATGTPAIFTDHDFMGTGRPQGGASDIGAFEQ